MLIYSILFILLSNSVTSRRDKSILYSRIALLALLSSALIAYNSLEINNFSRGIGLFGGLFHATSITQVFQIFIIVISAIILTLTSFYPRKVWLPEYSTLKKLWTSNFLFYKSDILNNQGEQYKIIEYPLIIIFVITGAIFLVSASDLVSIFLSIELQSYGLYLLSTIYRNSESATSGGLTYFLLGGLSSCFILLGTSLLYGNSGSSQLDGIYVISSLSDINTYKDGYTEDLLYWYKPYYINISLLILSVGFLFKISAAPFHFWSPDVYDGIPTIVTTFVAIVAKISILIFFLELVHYTSNSLFTFKYSWTTSLLFSSLLSLIIGSVLGLSQFRIKRLFAYSTISHVGFILLSLSIDSVESIQAFLFYLIQYSLSNLNAFIILITIGYSLYYYVNDNKEYKELVDKNNSPIQLISQLRGYFYINPILALSFSITIFSFAGIPPLMGFFAKQMVLSAALDNGYIFITLIGILTSVISGVYYLNIIKEVFFDKPDYKINPVLDEINLKGSIVKNNIILEKIKYKVENITTSSIFTITISILTLIITLFMFIPSEALNLTTILALVMFNL